MLKFGKTTSSYYEEAEGIPITIINQKPTISAPFPPTIIVYDDLVYSVNFTITDPENSPLLKLRFVGDYPSWTTLDPST